VTLGLLVIIGVGGIALLVGRRSAEERPVPVAAAAGGLAGGDVPVPPVPVPSFAPAPEPQPATAEAAAFATRVNSQQDEQQRGDPGAGGTPRVRRAWEASRGIEDAPIGTVDDVLIDGQPRAWERGEEDIRNRRKPRERDDEFEDD
jgi:hypothetical protein